MPDDGQPIVGVLELASYQIPYLLYRSAKRKRTLEMQVIHPQGLKVTAPKRWGIAAVKKILEDKKSWVVKEWLAQENNTLHYPLQWMTGEKISFLGEAYLLDILENAKKTSCALTQFSLSILLSAKDKFVKRVVETWLKKQAKIILQERCHFFASEMKLSYQTLAIANQKSRWGSCSETGDIRLNWRLILLPFSMIDYVIVHELAHLVHLNHQMDFWKLVEQYAPDYKNQRKLLKKVAIGRFT